MNLRRALLPVHRWTGMTVGLVVVVSAVTGAGLAFRKELDPVVYPRLFRASACSEPLPLDRFTARARALHPQGTIDFVRVRAGADMPIQVRFTNKDTLYFDRCTAALTASQNRYAGAFGVLENIHRGQWVRNGGWLMGVGALGVVLVLGGGGMVLWWPRKPRTVVQALSYDRRLQGPAALIALHRTVAGWAVVVLMLSAVTGLPNAFESLKIGLVALGATTPPSRPRSVAPASTEAARLSLQDAWTTATRLSPAPREMLVHLAHKPTDPVEIYIIDATAPHANARTYLWLDAYSGQVLRFAPYAQSGWGGRLYYWMLSVHTGQVGGPLGQLLLFLGALCAPVLAYTGIGTYLRRRQAGRTARRAASEKRRAQA